jgi:hypothetical protein
MQQLRWTAEEIGVDITYSPALTRVYYRDAYPRLPRAYRSRACRRGGRLDLDISYNWP